MPSRTPRDVATTASRDRVVDVAARLMAHNDYAGTSIAEICAESGVPVGSVYHHFGSKRGLLRTVLVRGKDRLFGSFPPTPPDGHPRDRIRAHYRNAGRTVGAHLMFIRIEIALLLQATEDREVRAILADLDAADLRRAVPLFTSIAAQAGAPEPERTGRRIATDTMMFSRGIVSRPGVTPQVVESAFATFGELMWEAIEDGGAPVPGRPALAPVPAVPRPLDAAATDSRERFLDVAERLMAASGYRATSVAEICSEAGLPIGSLYHHFGSKRGLLRAVLQRGAARFQARIAPIDHYPGSPRDRLLAFFRGNAVAVMENAAYFRLGITLRMQDEGDPEIRTWTAAGRRRGTERVAAALDRVVADTPVSCPTEVRQRLADISVDLIDGSICRLDLDVETLQAAFADTADLLWSALNRAVGPRRTATEA